jgi:hypothetical protein
MKSPNSLLYKLVFFKETNGNLLTSRSKNVKDLFSDLGFTNLWNNDNITTVLYKEFMISNYNNSVLNLVFFSNLESYNLFKVEFTKEKYLSCVNNLKHH